MTDLPRVLVTGATGKTGLATVQALIEHHSGAVKTRALVRTDDHRAQTLREIGAEVVIGDMSDIRDLRRAMRGVQRAHLIVANTNNSLDHALNFAMAAAAERLEHVVAIGQWLASESHPSLMTRRTSLVDRVLSWIPDVHHTVINVGFFARQSDVRTGHCRTVRPSQPPAWPRSHCRHLQRGHRARLPPACWPTRPPTRAGRSGPPDRKCSPQTTSPRPLPRCSAVRCGT